MRPHLRYRQRNDWQEWKKDLGEEEQKEKNWIYTLSFTQSLMWLTISFPSIKSWDRGDEDRDFLALYCTLICSIETGRLSLLI